MLDAKRGGRSMDKRYLAVGIALGAAIGAATNNLAIGLALGVVAGLILGKWQSGRNDGA